MLRAYDNLVIPREAHSRFTHHPQFSTVISNKISFDVCMLRAHAYTGQDGGNREDGGIVIYNFTVLTAYRDK